MTNTSTNAALITSILNDDDYRKAGHGKHTACQHEATKSARSKCRAERRLHAAGMANEASDNDGRTLTVMYAAKSSTTHYIAVGSIDAPVMACNGKSIKSVEFDEIALTALATCRNCAKLDATTTGSY